MMQDSSNILSAFCYGSNLQSTITAANLLRSHTGFIGINALTFQTQGNTQQLQQQTEKNKKEISPFDPEAIIPLPTQLNEYKAKTFGTTIWRRNERERYRVRCVNNAYDSLRNVLPFDEDEKRLSKVETLKLAIIYIEHLEKMLNEFNHPNLCSCFAEFQRQLVENEMKRIDQRLSGRDSGNNSGKDSDDSRNYN